MANELSVRLVDLPDMTVASARGFGNEPESLAFQVIGELAAKLGVEPAADGHELYGFNDPNPSADREEYGYELWMRVEPGTPVEPPVEIKEIRASSYAVTRCTGLSKIGRVWKELWAWYAARGHTQASPCEDVRWLESLQNASEPDVEKWIFDLYLSVSRQ